MTKAEKKALEDLMEQEISHALGESPLQHYAKIRPKLAQSLMEQGLIRQYDIRVGRDRLGEIIVPGYCLTEQGRFIYCTEVAGE